MVPPVNRQVHRPSTAVGPGYDGGVAADEDLGVVQVSRRVWVFTRGGERILESYGANCTAVAGKDAVLLVDPLIAPGEARRIEAAVAARTPAPIRYVALTHHHTDHALGAGYFSRKGIAVFAHRLCSERMRAEHPGLIESRRADARTRALFADADPHEPSDSFEEEARFDLGDVEAVARFVGPGHTPGDSVVHVADESLIVSGDLISRGYHANYEDASLDRLPGGLERLGSFGASIVVPGHGAPGDSGEIERQKSYHERFEATVREETRLGRHEGAVVARLRKEFPGFLLEEVLPVGIRVWQRRVSPATNRD
jgi:glyoxylase-like metal-dependent hydrolase (beta-lactamase superfamily II)